ncbi:MAG: RidA family protein [Deltaproteobacteria bacterium]|nr:RidA family protein [Deltaproteobacteria bacterium]
MKRIISTTKAPKAVGPYSQAVEINGFLYVCGQIPIDPAIGEVVEGNFNLQAKQVLKNLEAIITESGFAMTDVVKTTCFLKSMDDFEAFNKIYGTYFKTNPPARSCVAVRALPKDVMVEVEAIAAKFVKVVNEKKV